MTKLQTINQAYISKLEETGSHDLAILHIFDMGVKSCNEPTYKINTSIAKCIPDSDAGKRFNLNDGWIEHDSGEQPVDDNTLVEIKFRTGEICEHILTANKWHWNHERHGYDIIAYKVIE